MLLSVYVDGFLFDDDSRRNGASNASLVRHCAASSLEAASRGLVLILRIWYLLIVETLNSVASQLRGPSL